jgi:hypothetical protein
MALSASGLAAKITEIQGPAEDTAKQDAANLALATAIVEYIKANAQVSVTVTVSTTGGPAAQSGGGSGTGTIS